MAPPRVADADTASERPSAEWVAVFYAALDAARRKDEEEKEAKAAWEREHCERYGITPEELAHQRAVIRGQAPVQEPAPVPQQAARQAPRARSAKPAAGRRRTRSTSRDGPSSSSSDDEPPPARVTDSGLTERACEVCGEQFTPRRRSDARLCGPACKQRAYRLRRTAEKPQSVTPTPLTPSIRSWLHAEIDRRRRAVLAGEPARLRREWELAG
jgi:hypothetical protein